MRGDEARRVCPDIELIQVPVAHGKADLTQYRDAGTEVSSLDLFNGLRNLMTDLKPATILISIYSVLKVVAVLSRKGTCERASIDEVYLDITEASGALSLQEPFIEEVTKSHILGHSEVNDSSLGFSEVNAAFTILISNSSMLLSNNAQMQCTILVSDICCLV